DKAGTTALYGIEGGKAEVEPISAMVLVKEDTAAPAKTESVSSGTESKASESTPADTTESKTSESTPPKAAETTTGTPVPIPVVLGMFAALLLGIFVMIRARKK
ncbi:MAG: hypothetical protein ACSW75_04200, partial [Lachnospiraceae bacterium]